MNDIVILYVACNMDDTCLYIACNMDDLDDFCE